MAVGERHEIGHRVAGVYNHLSCLDKRPISQREAYFQGGYHCWLENATYLFQSPLSSYHAEPESNTSIASIVKSAVSFREVALWRRSVTRMTQHKRTLHTDQLYRMGC
jgi:hypothetical protein